MRCKEALAKQIVPGELHTKLFTNHGDMDWPNSNDFRI